KLEEPALIEFGTTWCGYCQAAQADIAAALRAHAGIRHIKVEDGKGKRLGRSYAVKLWPTLILTQRGTELGRVVRPANAAAISALLDQLRSSPK
ncbi:MAG TPA: thioredoxin family protein, partial [Steroidobacteraceae bacterium]|nr:thioredoxin family protein [Steroidobacteraceae bacterium]